MERLIQKYGPAGGRIPPPGEEGPTKTTITLPVGSRKNRANGTCHCTEEV
jgi:hypothetical protein